MTANEDETERIVMENSVPDLLLENDARIDAEAVNLL